MPGIFLSSIYRGNCLVANNRCGWFALQWELCSCMLLQGAWHTISSDGDTDLDKVDLDKCKWTTKNQYILVIGSFLLVVLALLPPLFVCGNSYLSLALSDSKWNLSFTQPVSVSYLPSPWIHRGSVLQTDYPYKNDVRWVTAFSKVHVWPWIKCPSTDPPLDSCGLV